MKTQESRLRTLIKGVEKKQEEILATHLRSFHYKIKSFVMLERHELFIEKVNATKESLDIKVTELQSLMSKEVKKLEENYNLLHGKIDVIVGEINHLVEFNNMYTKELQAKFKKDE